MQLNKPLDMSKIVENGGVDAKPLIIGDTIYMGAMDTYFYAINAKTGAKKWAYKTNGPILSSAAFDGKAIYFGSLDTHLYALSFDGTLLWNFKASGAIASSPAIRKGIIYFGSSDYNLYAVDTKAHKELWRFRTADEVVSDPIIVGNRIYFGSMDSYFYCLDLKGNIAWRFKANAPILMGCAAHDDNAIYFGSTDEHLYAVGFDGKLKWFFKTGEEVWNTATIHEGRIYFTCRDRYIYCLDTETGACIWKFRTEADPLCPPIIHKNRIFFGSDKIYCLNMDGNKVWEFYLDTPFALNGSVWKGNIIFGANDCKIRSLTYDGQMNWAFRTNGIIAPVESWANVQNPPKWNPHLFEPEVVKRAVSFNPYAVSALTNEKIYGGTDTTGINAYIKERSDVGAYRRKGGYIEKAKKKKVLDEILEQQAKEQWGI